MYDDLFTYEVEVANIPCDSKMDDDSEHEDDDDMGYDPSEVAFTGSEKMIKLSSQMKNLLMIRMKLLNADHRNYKAVTRGTTIILDLRHDLKLAAWMEIELVLSRMRVCAARLKRKINTAHVHLYVVCILLLLLKAVSTAFVDIYRTTHEVLYKVEDIVTCLVEYVKFWEDWEVDRYGNANLVIMEYLVNISKRRTFWSLNEDILKITILKTNTPYPSRKIRRIRACTHQRPQRNKAQYADGGGVTAMVVLVAVGQQPEMRQRRVEESEYDERVDRAKRNHFGLHRKTPPEKFFGGGDVVAGGGRVAGDGGGLPEFHGEGDSVYKWTLNSNIPESVIEEGFLETNRVLTTRTDLKAIT
ncbi:hypothetical protein Tco_0408620 [Tanacetum coccineum]